MAAKSLVEWRRAVFDPGPNFQTVGGQVVVLPNGTLVDFFTVIDKIPTAPFMTATLALKRSLDQGSTWSPPGDPIVASSMQSSFYVADPDTGQALRSADGLFDVAVGPTNGTLYAVWQDARFSSFAHESVAFSMSKDGALTWTEPVQINRTPSDPPVANQQAFVPSIAVTYYDVRFNGAEPEGLTDQWTITCKPKAKSDCSDPEDWGELRLTAESFDIRKAPNAGRYFLGDYDRLAAVKNNFLAAFSVSTATDPADLVSASFKKGK